MFQPSFVEVQPLDLRTIRILKELNLLDVNFDPHNWAIEEENKNEEIYQKNLALYNAEQDEEKYKVLKLAKTLKDKFTDEEYEMFIKSIELYFKPYHYQSVFGRLYGDNCSWNNGYKSHDGGNEYKSKKERELESYYSTNSYFSLSEILGDKGIDWTSTYDDSDLFYKLSQGWKLLGYDVYIAIFNYGRNYSITCFNIKNFNEDYDEEFNFIESYSAMTRIYIKRK